MGTPTDPPVPQVDDAFWFDYSKKLIENAIERRDQAAAKLQKLVLWLWGIYTGSAAIGFSLSEKDLSLGVTLLVASASASLIAVYWGTFWVQMPIRTDSFDPRSPDEISSAYLSSLEKKDSRLKLTLVLSIIAAVMVSVSLLATSVSDKVSQTTSLSALLKKSGNSRLIALSATGISAESVHVTVHSVPENGSRKLLVNAVSIPTNNGILQTSLSYQEPVDIVDINLEWKQKDGLNMRINRRIEVKQTP